MTQPATDRPTTTDEVTPKVEPNDAEAAAAVSADTAATADAAATEPAPVDAAPEEVAPAEVVTPALPEMEPRLTAEEAADLAKLHGLKPIGLRPAIPEYLRQMWSRRYFVIELSRAREQSSNAESRLGQFWQVLNPLLNIAVYFLVFGILFKAARSVPDYLSFLVIGVFVFTYTQSTVMGGARSISGNLGLVRALHFPRALMPLSVVIEEFFTLATAMTVCIVIVLINGEGITFAWLLLPVTLGLQTLFNFGLALIVARMTERVRDVAQLLPFLLRTWLYLSGVVFPIQTFAQEHPGPIGFLLSFNPGAVFIELARDALLTSYSTPPITWVYAVFWAFVTLIVGFVYFWKAEEKYGRG
jgi:teichoic acid transport system permease protein